jgi:hypothetical protein
VDDLETLNSPGTRKTIRRIGRFLSMKGWKLEEKTDQPQGSGAGASSHRELDAKASRIDAKNGVVSTLDQRRLTERPTGEGVL